MIISQFKAHPFSLTKFNFKHSNSFKMHGFNISRYCRMTVTCKIVAPNLGCLPGPAKNRTAARLQHRKLIQCIHSSDSPDCSAEWSKVMANSVFSHYMNTSTSPGLIKSDQYLWWNTSLNDERTGGDFPCKV